MLAVVMLIDDDDSELCQWLKYFYHVFGNKNAVVLHLQEESIHL